MSDGPKNTLEEPGRKSVRVNNDDVDRAEDLGIAGISASTAFSDLLEEQENFQTLKERKRRELEKRVVEIRDEAEEWGIDTQELGVTVR